jgi:hypothetical protein
MLFERTVSGELVVCEPFGPKMDGIVAPERQWPENRAVGETVSAPQSRVFEPP